MPPRLSPWCEGYITALSDVGFTYSAIIAKHKERQISVSKCVINRIRNDNKKKQPGDNTGTPQARKKHPTPKRTKEVVKKVKAAVTKENPATQRVIASSCGVSPATVNRIIARDLALEKRHKPKVHKLTIKHIMERKTNSRKLYERHLAGDRWKKVVTLDEAWIYLNDCNKIRAIFYRPSGSKCHSEWVRECKETFSKGFMVVAGYCYYGKLTLHRIAGNAKVNAAYYQANVLDPIYRQDIPRLYGADSGSVWIHQDKASSHTAKSTVAYMRHMEQETGIRHIPYTTIPVKSPDASPMDFCGFGLLKRAMGKRRPRTVEGLWKACQEEWDRISVVSLQRSLLEWKVRCRAIARMQGKHIEHNRWWRTGFT